MNYKSLKSFSITNFLLSVYNALMGNEFQKLNYLFKSFDFYSISNYVGKDVSDILIKINSMVTFVL